MGISQCWSVGPWRTALPLKPGSPTGLCSCSGSKPGSGLVGTSSPPGGSPGSQCSSYKCAWAWGARCWGPGPPPERHPALPEIPRASASSHPGTCQSAAASGLTRLLWLRPSPDPTGCPPGRDASKCLALFRESFLALATPGSSSLLQPNCQLIPEWGRPKWQVKPQS